MKMIKFQLKFHLICSFVSTWQLVSTGPENDLMPNRQQTIILTNDGLFYWRLYASLSLNELISAIKQPA